VQLGVVPLGGSPEEMDRFMRAEVERWTNVVRQRGIRAE
jgi:hypothetical protein